MSKDRESDKLPTHDKVLTDDGLTFKGAQRIGRINCDADNLDITVRSWQCSRLIRRDFYLVTYKLFFVMRARANHRRVKELLADIQEEALVLESMARRWEIPEAMVTTPLRLRLVNAESQSLLDSILIADKAIAKMSAGPMAEVIAESLVPFLNAFTYLKKFVLVQNSTEEVHKSYAAAERVIA